MNPAARKPKEVSKNITLFTFAPILIFALCYKYVLIAFIHIAVMAIDILIEEIQIFNPGEKLAKMSAAILAIIARRMETYSNE